MRLAVLTSTISRNAGGLFNSVRYLHQLIGKEVPTRVISLRDEHTATDLSVWYPLEVELHDHRGPMSFGYSPTMKNGVQRYGADLVHVHGIWQGPSMVSDHYFRKTGRPHVISPRGMLDQWAFQNSRWKKRTVGRLFEYRHLRTAACMNALCKSEAQSIRAFGLNNPICVIPNGIHLPEIEADEKPRGSRKKKMLFLGRLHPKKGLMNAIRAWKNVSKTKTQGEWQFVIAGWDQGGHLAELEKLCHELGVLVANVSAEQFLANPTAVDEASVVFVGPAFGEQKDALLRQSTAFILPSFSEGLPMSVLEAWAYKLPVLMTDHCNIPEGFTCGAAIRIGTEVDSIVEGISLLFQSTGMDSQKLGVNGHALVSRQFTWPQVAVQMKEVYEWVLGGGEKPACVE